MRNGHLEVGEDVWFHNGGKDNPLIMGKVEAAVRLEGYGYDVYILSHPTHVDDLLVVRSYHSVSPDEKGPINLFRRPLSPTHNPDRKEAGE